MKVCEKFGHKEEFKKGWNFELKKERNRKKDFL